MYTVRLLQDCRAFSLILTLHSQAIATAQLLKTDPRAAALSSLSMSLFGTITILFTAIPSIQTLVRSLVGL